MLVAISPRALLTSSCGISHTGILNVSNDTPPGSCNTVHATAFNRIEMRETKVQFSSATAPRDHASMVSYDYWYIGN